MRRTAPGFSLIELLIVLAVIALIVAIGVPALLRARLSSGESAVIGDVRSVISAQAAYQSANAGWYESLMCCMARKGGCLPGAPTNAPIFLDSQMSSLLPKLGYARSLVEVGGAPVAADPVISPSSVAAYVYGATPMYQGQTGIRGFGGDSSGRVCFTPDGNMPPTDGRGNLAATCRQLK